MLAVFVRAVIVSLPSGQGCDLSFVVRAGSMVAEQRLSRDPTAIGPTASVRLGCCEYTCRNATVDG